MIKNGEPLMFSIQSSSLRADEGPFLHEERQLLENIATIVCNYLNSQQAISQSDVVEEDTGIQTGALPDNQ